MSSSGWHFVVSWFLIVIGWVVVNHQNNIREQRKEDRSMLNDISSMVDEITSLSLRYHKGVDHISELSSEIRDKIQKVSKKITLLGYSCEAVVKCVAEYRKSITLNNFDSPINFSSQSDDSSLVKRINECSDSLIESLEDVFFARYKSGLKGYIAYLRNFIKFY